MSEQNLDKRKNPGYELTDAEFRPVFLSGVALFLVPIVALGLMAGLFLFFKDMREATPVEISPLSEGRQLPPVPRLQVAPEADWESFRARQDSLLNSYGWVMKEAGLVRVPIEKAMEIALERGFPARSEEPRPDKQGK